MRGNNVLGLIFSNMHEEQLHDLTENRTMGSVPYGGRYCFIDFPLSNMVNSGISKVGVITKRNFQSLMDHLGSGKSWNLSRKREGLFILPPFGSETSNPNDRIGLLESALPFLQNSKEEFVLITDSNIICNIDYGDVLAQHAATKADITLVSRRGKIPAGMASPGVYTADGDGRVTDMLINPRDQGECCFGLNMVLIRRELLIRLVSDCVSRNMCNFKRDLLQRNISNYKVYLYEFRGVAQIVCSEIAYFESNLSLMLPEVRGQLFNPSRPIYTKVHDDMPARYGLGASVSNSLISDGCVIEGEVNNCVLSRGVHVGRNTKLENCILLQDTSVSDGCRLSYVIADKNVLIKNERSLLGFESYPVYISKGSIV